MPPTKPQPNPRKKQVKKIKILQVKRTEEKSLLSEHFYLVLVVLLGCVVFFLTAFGLRFYESAIVGLWIAGIVFFIRQMVRFVKGEAAPKKKEKKEAEAQTQKYTPPALPRVSKDFSPMPPAGDKRYPPPSPFIRPPK
jgi:hypothetical protein